MYRFTLLPVLAFWQFASISLASDTLRCGVGGDVAGLSKLPQNSATTIQDDTVSLLQVSGIAHKGLETGNPISRFSKIVMPYVDFPDIQPRGLPFMSKWVHSEAKRQGQTIDVFESLTKVGDMGVSNVFMHVMKVSKWKTKCLVITGTHGGHDGKEDLGTVLEEPGMFTAAMEYLHTYRLLNQNVNIMGLSRWVAAHMDNTHEDGVNKFSMALQRELTADTNCIILGWDFSRITGPTVHTAIKLALQQPPPKMSDQYVIDQYGMAQKILQPKGISKWRFYATMKKAKLEMNPEVTGEHSLRSRQRTMAAKVKAKTMVMARSQEDDVKGGKPQEGDNKQMDENKEEGDVKPAKPLEEEPQPDQIDENKEEGKKNEQTDEIKEEVDVKPQPQIDEVKARRTSEQTDKNNDVKLVKPEEKELQPQIDKSKEEGKMKEQTDENKEQGDVKLAKPQEEELQPAKSEQKNKEEKKPRNISPRGFETMILSVLLKNPPSIGYKGLFEKVRKIMRHYPNLSKSTKIATQKEVMHAVMRLVKNKLATIDWPRVDKNIDQEPMSKKQQFARSLQKHKVRLTKLGEEKAKNFENKGKKNEQTDEIKEQGDVKLVKPEEEEPQPQKTGKGKEEGKKSDEQTDKSKEELQPVKNEQKNTEEKKTRNISPKGFETMILAVLLNNPPSIGYEGLLAKVRKIMRHYPNLSKSAIIGSQKEVMHAVMRLWKNKLATIDWPKAKRTTAYDKIQSKKQQFAQSLKKHKVSLTKLGEEKAKNSETKEARSQRLKRHTQRRAGNKKTGDFVHGGIFAPWKAEKKEEEGARVGNKKTGDFVHEGIFAPWKAEKKEEGDADQ